MRDLRHSAHTGGSFSCTGEPDATCASRLPRSQGMVLRRPCITSSAQFVNANIDQVRIHTILFCLLGSFSGLYWGLYVQLTPTHFQPMEGLPELKGGGGGGILVYAALMSCSN